MAALGRKGSGIGIAAEFRPEDWFTIVYSRGFDSKWAELGFGDGERRELEAAIGRGRAAAPVLPGTDGVRKIRFGRVNQGKSGGVRVLFVVFPEFEVANVISVFAKNEKANISADERNVIRQGVARLREIAKRQWEGKR